MATNSGDLVLRHEIDNGLQRGVMKIQQIAVAVGLVLTGVALASMFGGRPFLSPPLDQILLMLGLFLGLANLKPMLTSMRQIGQPMFVALDPLRREFVIFRGVESRLPMDEIEAVVPFELPSGVAPRAPQATLLLKDGSRHNLPYMLVDGVNPIEFFSEVLAKMRRHPAP